MILLIRLSDTRKCGGIDRLLTFSGTTDHLTPPPTHQIYLVIIFPFLKKLTLA